MHTLFQKSLIEFLVVLLVGANVDVKRMYFGTRLFHYQVSELERSHAADTRTVGVMLQITAANTVNDRDRFGRRLTVAQYNLAIGRAGRIAQSLKFKARIDIRQPAVTELGNLAAIEGLPARRNDDVADV